MPPLLLAAALFAAPPPAGDAPAAGAGVAELSEGEKLSYALGVNVARGLLRDGLDPDAELFLAGLRDALTDRPLRLREEELAAALDAAAARVREAAAARAREAAEEASAAFLADFAAADGAGPLDGGGFVKKVTTGDGPTPAAGGRVRLHYSATVAGAADPFFTTRGGPPAAADVAAMLPGLRAVLPTMPAGSRWELALPAARAYGAAGGPGVPPHTALRLDVELLDVLPAAGPAPAGNDVPAGTGDPAGGADAP